VRKATLNNFGDILRKDIKVGSRVAIRRSNEVIPEILGCIEHTGESVNIHKPTVCPYCGSEVYESGANIFCPNTNCRPRVIGKLQHFAQKDAMDIDGFSEMTAGQLYDKCNLTKCSQLYELTMDDLADLDGFKDKKITNLLTAIESSKKVTLEKFIFALGIDGVGKVAARDLAKTFKSIQNLRGATCQSLIEMENIGDITADGIVSWFADDNNLEELDNLLKYVVIEEAKKPVEGGIFAGQFVVLTGTLTSFKRSQAQKIIEEQGGECQSAVTSKTTLVIAGEAAGSKLEKAQKLGIKVIDEAQFKELLG
jgi:DNA ligase (NAD+)